MKYLVLAALLTQFTAYPEFGDSGIATPREANTTPRVEATTDRGPIVELIIRCANGTAIISYSKVERLFCTPSHACNGVLERVIATTCH